MAAELASTAAPTPSEYIVHHLSHFSTAAGGKQTSIVDFSVINLDTVFWSILMGVVGLFFMMRAAKKVTSGVPGRFQALVEMVVELVEDQSKSIVHGNRTFIAPLALTVFVWVLLMNSLDFLPVDLFDKLFKMTGLDHYIHFHRVVPTADLNGTLGMALGVFALMLYYNFKIKGVGGFVHELYCAPFGNVKLTLNPLSWIGFALLSFANLGINLIEFVARTVSLAMRLFGNMFAGELVFLLIALLGATATWWGFGMQVVAGSIWAIFHILIVLLQAFIFMMLTLVYMGQAHDSH